MGKNILSFIALLLLFVSSINAQENFRIEIGIGPALGESSDYFSFALQGNIYYLWGASENINIGPTIGGLIFWGEGDKEVSNFSSVPDVYIPIAFAARIDLSRNFSLGSDLGYGWNISGEGGFYYRPIIAYDLKNLALIASYASINESDYTASTINVGISFGF